MEVKRTLVGQSLIDGLGDSDDAYPQISGSFSLIGEIVVMFNLLESQIDSIICEMISDRSAQHGLLVLANMMYSTKVDLFERFARDRCRDREFDLNWLSGFISSLKECGTLRNKVVHANWMQTDSDGYTQAKIKYQNNSGLEHELVKFTAAALEAIVSKIESAIDGCSHYDENYLWG